MGKLKPILPCLKENKRYLAVGIVSDKEIKPNISLNGVVKASYINLFGVKGLADAGLMLVKDDKDKAIFRVNNRHLDDLRASLCDIRKFDGQDVIVRSLGASGILKKANQHITK